MTITTWNIEAMTGYKPITTFYEDFSIADRFGVNAVQDTFNRAFESWKGDYKYLTELVMVMSWKSFEHHTRNEALCNLYCDLFSKADEYACENLQGKELSYFYKTTD